MKRQPKEWEKIFVHQSHHKYILEGPLQFNNESKPPNFKTGKGLEWIFLQRKCTNDLKAPEEMFNITQHGYYKKKKPNPENKASVSM